MHHHPRLIVTLVVLLLVGAGVWGWRWLDARSGQSLGHEEQTFYCCFDDTVVTVETQDVMPMCRRGEAATPSLAPGGPPLRVQCPECGRLSCFKLDPETGEEIEADPAWDLRPLPHAGDEG
ncbi:MAG: hypothetical protein AAGA29_09860 [Planctomycetota bacterium]